MKLIAMPLTLLLLAVAGCQRTPAPAPEPVAKADIPPVASAPAAEMVKAGWQGYGPLPLGTDAEQLQQLWDGELQGDAVADGGCYYLTPSGQGDAPLMLMIEGDHFVRYDVRDASEPAPGGGRAGMPLGELQALYRQADPLQPHKYVEGGHYLRVPATDGSGSMLVFDIGADGQARAWRVGLPPQVDYVEGCS